MVRVVGRTATIEAAHIEIGTVTRAGKSCKHVEAWVPLAMATTLAAKAGASISVPSELDFRIPGSRRP